MEHEGTTLVSTGHLPPGEDVARLVAEAHAACQDVREGEVSQVYPALARAPRDLFGVAVAGVSGALYEAGDTGAPFAIMSVAKPFVYALACDAMGPDAVRDVVGANATGLPFNDTAAVERSADGRTNPMVNPGAIATVSLLPGEGAEEKWDVALGGLSRFAGRPLRLDEETYMSASATNHRNRELAALLDARGGLSCPADMALDLYTRQSCVSVTARDLAVMGATLADGGVNPVTGERVVGRDICHYVLAAMMTARLYETSGDWLHDVGLPAKSGIGGGIVAAAPGKGGLGTFAPPLDAAGNSVKGQLAARLLARRLGLDLLQSDVEPAERRAHSSPKGRPA